MPCPYGRLGSFRIIEVWPGWQRGGGAEIGFVSHNGGWSGRGDAGGRGVVWKLGFPVDWQDMSVG